MRKLTCICVLMGLTACGPNLSAKSRFTPDADQMRMVQQTVSYNLRDPGSAQFRNVRGVNATAEDGRTAVYICGEINAKNALGGYTGFTPFVYDPRKNTAQIARRQSGGISIADQAIFSHYC